MQENYFATPPTPFFYFIWGPGIAKLYFYFYFYWQIKSVTTYILKF